MNTIRVWLRWAALHGAVRAYMAAMARSGDPLARILVTDAGRRDIYRLTERIRAEGRLTRMAQVWVTTDHEIAGTILRDKRFGVSDPDSMDVPRPVKWAIRNTELDLMSPGEPPSMLVTDPPAHTRYRKLVTQTFTPRAIERLRPRIEQMTGELLDAMADEPCPDLIACLAAQLPVSMITEILGMPAELRPDMLDYGDKASALLDVAMSWRLFARGVDGLRDANALLGNHLDRLLVDPGDDLFSELTRTDLDRRELLATGLLVVGAGFETTVNLLGNGVKLLLEHPDQLAALRADPSLWPNAVEEMLRYDSPVQMTARNVLCDVELAGRTVRAGQTVIVLLGAANRDPAVFDDPGRFDVTRRNAREHLTFGKGIHACLGASLARMQATTALPALFERFPDLRLAGPPTERGLVVLHGYKGMPVTIARPQMPLAG